MRESIKNDIGALRLTMLDKAGVDALDRRARFGDVHLDVEVIIVRRTFDPAPHSSRHRAKG